MDHTVVGRCTSCFWISFVGLISHIVVVDGYTTVSGDVSLLASVFPCPFPLLYPDGHSLAVEWISLPNGTVQFVFLFL